MADNPIAGIAQEVLDAAKSLLGQQKEERKAAGRKRKTALRKKKEWYSWKQLTPTERKLAGFIMKQTGKRQARIYKSVAKKKYMSSVARAAFSKNRRFY